MLYEIKVILTLIGFLGALGAVGQSPVKISVEEREMLTYPYNDPNPVAYHNAKTEKIYPYHLFEGYSHTGVKKKWKVVKLENDYIEVYILPEVGGKVWGAVEKSTGKEFIYKNEVMKFRNIAMRGPWTSGGIEFNFGLVGHTPSTASPVDYVVRSNDDGSVSCVVGNMDLPSRTRWHVDITLPKDKAYFITKAFWTNPTSLPQPYYNYMTGAAVVSDDLQFFYPGPIALEHDGSPTPWPVDEKGRDLSRYPNNAFGTHKSIHIVGEYNDFMGGYYHESEFGFGHWALYDEMPGRKLWLWALSRNGGIWEDLLTDTDGQYMEFQAGRTLNQYLPSRSVKTPITQIPFSPHGTDRWSEIWFPVKEIGGLHEVSPYGVLHVTKKGNGAINIGVNALAFADAQVTVKVNDKTVYTAKKSFKPMEVWKASVPLNEKGDFEVSVEGMDLVYHSVNKNRIKRPFQAVPRTKEVTQEERYREGVEHKEYREYDKAKEKFLLCLSGDSLHFGALADLSELYIRQGLYDSALWSANRILRHDTYDPAGNYMAGVAYWAKGDLINALESFGWASRSATFATAAYAQMAAIKMQQKDDALVEYYAQKALDYNRNNLRALHVLASTFRRSGQRDKANALLEDIARLDPLDHFVRWERYRLSGASQDRETFVSQIRNEFPYQTFLELALEYRSMGMTDESLQILSQSPAHPLTQLWSAYLGNDERLLNQVVAGSPAFVFPYRPETIPVLEWALSRNNHWKFRYYLGLNYFGVRRYEEARKMLAACAQEPDFAPFYITRARLNEGSSQVLSDLQRARTLAPHDWRTWSELINHYFDTRDYRQMMEVATRAAKKFADNYTLRFQYAQSLLYNGQYKACIKELENLNILPFEGSTQGKVVYEQAHLFLALERAGSKKYKEALHHIRESKRWPENLGVGEPFDPDTRVADYLAAYCHRKLGNSKEAVEQEEKIVAYSMEHYREPSLANLLPLIILSRNEESARANELLQRIRQLSSPHVYHRWVVDTFAGNQPAPSSDLVNDKQYELIKRLQALGGN